MHKHFLEGMKVDFVSHTAFVLSLFPRNSMKGCRAKVALLAGMFTPSPQTLSKKRCQHSGQCEIGCPFAAKKLAYYTEGSEKAVWNSDHDYVKPQALQELGETVES